ncbi:FkbM family methyltransferase [Belnapia sp. T6]|uniref:FkbM family methyltransferase n=1 Tax=Belnapia mucosa TaxID=2804532 RepID=A0ABS1V4E2_9PROT|nr:FkbM family methyltransferase [Belnapia mucosa]MBL6455554.1 FkbM family methyltransferase [Belnapia mucosa]
MHEQSKAAKRRIADAAFLTRYMVGEALDIGAGPDGLTRHLDAFPRLRSVREWDLPDGDAQYLAGVADASFDLVHASHCLEHIIDPRIALCHWIRVTRPGGHLVITVPDEDMYERGHWPSRANPDHKWSFTACKAESWAPKSINVLDLAREFSGLVELERIQVLRDFFRPGATGDQTMGPVAECAIEFVLRRREAAVAAPLLHGAADRSLIPPIGRMRLKACRQGLMAFSSQDTNVGRLLDTYGEYAEAEVALFAQLLRPGDVAVDADANIGSLAVPLARLVGTGGLVHAFEPQPHVHRTLVANAVLNELDHLHCWNAALGEVPGTIEVPRINPGARRDAAADAARGLLVTVMTVDGLDLPRCRLIKADVEGMEAHVLRGARATIARCRPLLYLEADQPPAVAAVLEELVALGYAPFWHVVPYVQGANYFGRPVEFFRGIVAVNLLAAPPGFTVNGLPPVTSPDWQADLRRAAA